MGQPASGARGFKPSLPSLAAVLATFILLSAAACGSAGVSEPTDPTVSPSASPTVTPTQSPAPTDSSSATPEVDHADLDGLVAPPESAHNAPLAVMIDDQPAARPQSGFTAAAIVYQAQANGGVLRYMLVYQETEASAIGPVRSARPYFVRWASEYHAIYAHWGASPLDLRSTLPGLANEGALYNMDGLAGAAKAYHRVTTRPAPHNVYTDTATLRQMADSLGYPATIDAGVQSRPFIDEVPVGERPAAGSITVPYRAATISYTYDAATNSYQRSVGGTGQIDQANGQRVAPKNVVILFQDFKIDQAKDNYLEPVIADVGSGKAMVFRNGQMTLGIWRKTANSDLTRLYDSADAEIPLVRGQIFIQSVPLTTKVSYT